MESKVINREYFSKNISISMLQIAAIGIALYYVLLFIYCSVSNISFTPDLEIIIFQIVNLLLIVSVATLARTKFDSIPIIVLIVHLLVSSCLFIYYYNNNLPYGYNAHDSFFYEDIIRKTQGFGFFEFLGWLRHNVRYFSDYGYPIVRYFIGIVSENIIVQNYALVLLNAVLIFFSVKFLGTISARFLGLVPAKLVMLLWGFNAFGIYLNASGLKDNIFVFLIISTFYFFEKFQIQGRSHNFIFLCVCIMSTAFFRWYLTIIILFVILFQRIFEKGIVEKKLPILLIGLIFSGVFLSNIVQHFSINNKFLNLSISLQEYRSGGQFGAFINFVSSLIGPFPSLLEVKQTAPLIYATGNFIKMLFSYFFIIASFSIFRTGKRILYPYVVYCFLIICFLIFSNTSLDMRFQYTMLPFIFLLGIYGVIHATKLQKTLFIFYLLFLVAPLTILYNLRG